MGIFSSAILGRMLFKWILSDQFGAYIDKSNRSLGFESGKAIKFLGIIIGIPCVLLIVLGMDWYIVFGKDNSIAWNRFWGFGERRYSYQQIAAIYDIDEAVAPNGDVIQKPYYAIRFNDGEYWSTRDFGPDDTHKNFDTLVQFVAKRSGKNIKHIKRLEEQ